MPKARLPMVKASAMTTTESRLKITRGSSRPVNWSEPTARPREAASSQNFK